MYNFIFKTKEEKHMKRKILASLLLLSMAISSFSGIGGIQVHATEYNNLSTSETTEVASTESPSTEAVSTEVQTESSTEGILPELPVDLNTDLNNITGEEDLSDEISNNDNETDADVPAGITLDDLNISARDGFGELFAKEFEGEATEYSNEENIVYSVELEQGIATVSYHADIDCSLVIALYDESGKKLQTSEVTEVQSDVGTTTVTMDMSNAPSYFLLRAYLINTDTKDPLSKEYENNLYTKEMQEFLSKDVNDFNQEQVINFDDDPKTNFAVVNNDVIVVDYVEGENIVTKQDLTTEEYEIQRATDTIKNLQPGDIMLYEYKEFYLIVGVSDITVDGDTVNIKGTELEAEDVFDHIRIEESSNTDQMNYDSSECDDALSYDGLTNITAKGETSGSVSGSFKYTFKEKPINERTKFTGSIEFSGKITAKLYRSLEETYVEISGDTTIKLNVSIQAKDRLVKNFKLGYIDYMIGPVFIGFTPSFVCEVKSDISWEGSYQSGFILKVSTKGPEHITFQQKQPVIQTELKSEIDVFFGVSLEPHIWMLTPKFAEVKFTCKAGAEIKGKSSIEYSTEISDTNHDCSSCVAGEIDAVAEAKISAEILVVEFSAGVTKSSKISDFYYSFDTKKFGFTTCPNISYQYNLTVKDKKTKKPVKNAVVTIDGNEYKTDKNGHCIKFLKKGVHDITIKDSKNRSLAFNINIKNDAIKSTQYLKSADGTGDEEAGEILHSGEFDTWKWSLDSNGLLLIEGDVKGSDFSFYTPPWIDYNEDIKIAKLEGAGFGRLCSMFNGCRGLTNLDVSNFDTSKVTDMRHMFYGCRGLTNLDVSNFDTSNVTDMFGMFWGCSGLTNLDVSNFDTSKVTSMDSMFNGCSGLTNLDVSNFDTSNVTSMDSMFNDCSGLTNLDVSNFDTSKVTSMDSMFGGCSGLTNLDVSNFDTSKVTDMDSMFYGCRGLTNLDVSNFDTSKVTDMFGMFWGCSGLTNLDLSNFDTSSVTSMDSMFGGCNGLTNLDLSNFDTSKVTDMPGMFWGCSGLTNLDVSNFDTSSVTSMDSMFGGCSSLTNLDVSNFDTSKVTDMPGMFGGCSSLTNLDVSNFDTSNVTSMYCMFNGCSGLTNLDVSNFDTSNVTNMGSMFGGCSSLTNLDVSNFDTSNVTSMYSMFNGCSGLINLDVSNFNTSNVTDMRYMFDRCSGLTQIKSPYNINTDCDLYTNDNAKWIDESGIEVTCMHENISHSVTYTRISENNQSDEAFINSAPKNALRSLTEGDVTSNTIVNQDNYYNIYVTSNSLIENPLSKDNLLYIIQATNDTKETLCEELKASYPDASIYVTSMYKIQLEDSNITIDELTYTGKTMLPNIHVTVNDKELEQGKDYDVYGDLAVKDAGTYSITVYGIGDYSGSVSLEYKVKGNYTYSVEFDGNGAIAGTMTTLTNCESDEIYVLPTCKYKRKGFIFAGWNTKKDGSGTSYEDESKVSNLSNQNNDVVTLYAQWKPISYTIHFDKNGGTGTMKRVYPKYGRNYRLPANTFKKAGYTFAGWNTRKDGKGTTYKNQCNVKNLSSKNGELIRFYAQWKKISLATPGKPTLGNYAAGRLTVTCKEVKRADGYLIQYSTNKNMKNAKTVSTTTLKKNIYKLKKGTTYYVRVRAYKVDSTGKKVCGKYSGIQSKKVTK